MATKKSPTKMMFADEEERTPQEAPEKPSEPEDKPTLPSGSNFLHLPSQGRLGYPSEVTYRDILVKDEEKLSMATPETYAKTLNSVLKSILNDPEFFEDMCVHDRDYALVWLWANNYSPVKKVDIKCGSCSHQEEHSVDLTQVEVDDVNPKIPVPFDLPIGDPSDEKKLFVRLNTVGDELLVEDFLKKEENNKKYTFEHLMMVASIQLDFKVSFENKIRWVGDNIKSKEMAYVKKFHQFFKYGVNDVVDHKCSECGEVTKGSLPFSASDILWPTVDVDFEEFL